MSTDAPIVLTRLKSGQPLMPYQRAWINDPSPRKLGDKSRRTGWTYAEAYDAVSVRQRRTNPRDMDYWFSSADESSAEEFIEYCRFFSQDLFGQIADYYTEQVVDPQTNRYGTKHCIRCRNGFRITGMTSNPRRFRSKGGDVTLDEYAFHDEAGAMYDAAQPVTSWGGKMNIFSTPNGEGTEYDRMVVRCRKVLAAMGYDPDRPPRDLDFQSLADKASEMRCTPIFSYHRVTIVDAVEQGLVDRINATRGTSFTKEQFLRNCRESCRNNDSYMQEYMCVASVGSEVWLPYSLIESCESDQCPAPDQPIGKLAGGQVFIGVDVGRSSDYTVFWIDEYVGDVGWCRGVHYHRNMSLPDQKRELVRVARETKAVRTAVDKTGIGLGLYEFAAEELGQNRVLGVQFSEPSKLALSLGIKDCFDDKKCRIPSDNSQIRDGLHKVRRSTTAGGHVVFDAKRDAAGHADEFWAKALAVYAMNEGSEVGIGCRCI